MYIFVHYARHDTWSSVFRCQPTCNGTNLFTSLIKFLRLIDIFGLDLLVAINFKDISIEVYITTRKE